MRLVTFTTMGSARLAANWLASVQGLGLDEFAIVYCADQPTAAAMTKYLIASDCAAQVIEFDWVPRPPIPPMFESSDAPLPLSAEWGTREFYAIALAKLNLLVALTGDVLSFDPFLFCDADTVLVESPFDYLRSLLRDCNEVAWLQSNRADQLLPRAGHAEFNPGVSFCARTDSCAVWQCARSWLIKRFAEHTSVDEGHYFDDQDAVNFAIEFLPTLPVGVLNPVAFRNGQMNWGSPGAWLLHANWLKGLAPKEARFKASGHWYAPRHCLQVAGL